MTTKTETNAIHETLLPMVDEIASRFEDYMHTSANRAEKLLEEARGVLRNYAENNNDEVHPGVSRVCGMETLERACDKISWSTAPKVLRPYSVRFGTDAERKAQNTLGQVIREGERIAAMTPEAITTEANQAAHDEVLRFSAKIADKVNGLGTIKNSSVSGQTTEHFTLTIEFASGRVLTLKTNIKWTVSKNGKHFPQWPTLIYENGKRLTMSDLQD